VVDNNPPKIKFPQRLIKSISDILCPLIRPDQGTKPQNFIPTKMNDSTVV